MKRGEAMIACRYVGSDSCEIGLREFDTVGQRAVMGEQGFRDAVLGRAAFIPEESFARIGFTERELSEYGQSGARDDPPNSFVLKLMAAQDVYRDLHGRMLRDPMMTLSDISGQFVEQELGELEVVT